MLKVNNKCLNKAYYVDRISVSFRVQSSGFLNGRTQIF